MMLKKSIKPMALMIMATIAFGSAGVFALDYKVPEGANFKTARFSVSDIDSPGTEFSMLSEDGELIIHISDETILPFSDVNPNAWFHRSVEWAFQNGIMSGISETEFAPDGEMTRAMLVTVLWRYAGSPGSGEAPFADVESGIWYNTAVAWAAANGIVSGYNETTFGPSDPINREQMYTVLYRYMNFAGLSIELDDEMRLRQFADQDEISEWALDALFFMYDAGITFQLSTLDNNARPKEAATRGEIAGAIYFFDKYAFSPQQTDHFKVEYIRTNWHDRNSEITVISSFNAFNQLSSDLTDFLGNAYGQQYTDDFFMRRYLVIVSLEEPSGSIRHRVERVEENGDIVIVRLVPEIGTADMAGWDIIIELDKAFTPDIFNIVIIDEHF